MSLRLPDDRSLRGRRSSIGRRLVQAVLGWLLACLCTVAAAQDHITARAYWEEPCSRHTLAQVQARGHEFVPYTHMLARDYGPCAVWVRLRIDPAAAAQAASSTAAPQAQPLILRMRPAYLDEVELFDPLFADGAARITGDRHPPNADEYRLLSLQFSIPTGDAPRDIWLRLATTSTRMLDVQALPLSQAIAGDRTQELAYAAYLGLLVASLLWALLHWLQSRERVIGVFVFKHVVTLAWSVMLMGYGRALFGDAAPPGMIDTLTSLLVILAVPSAAWFDYTLLREYRPPRAGMRLLMGIVVGCLVLELLLFAIGQAWLALRINAVVVLIGEVLVFSLAVLARPPADAEAPALPKSWLVGLYGVICTVFTLSMLVHLGLVPGHRLVLSTLFLHGLLTGVIMLVLLTVRARRLARRQADAQTQLALARRLVQHERLHREEQEKLLDMLTHELKTPLAVVRMLLGAGAPSSQQVGQIRRALTDMNDVIERCAQTEQLHGGRLQAQPAPCDLRAELGEFAAHWRATQRLELRCELPDDSAATLHTDAKLLRIIVANLLDNACKYSPADSTVTTRLLVCTRAQAQAARSWGPPHAMPGEAPRERAHQKPADPRRGILIEIENVPGSAGWPDPERVFDRYYRSPMAHRQTGSGLGLYLVAGLTRLLDGVISYQPTASHVRFRLWLPA